MKYIVVEYTILCYVKKSRDETALHTSIFRVNVKAAIGLVLFYLKTAAVECHLGVLRVPSLKALLLPLLQNADVADC